MVLYLIGTFVEIFIVLFLFFLEPISTTNFEYGRIKGVGSVYKEGAKNTYSLYEIMGEIYIFLAIVIIVALLLYFVLIIKKQTNIIPGFILKIISFVPLAFMIIAKIMVSSEAKYVGNSVAVYGSGVKGNINGVGWFLIILMVASCASLLIGLKKVETEIMENANTSVKEVKTRKKIDVSSDDFKM